MPRLSDNFEKLPVDKDYEGLQLDTRARDPEKYLDGTKPQAMLDDDFDDQANYVNEKQTYEGFTTHEQPMSPGSDYSAYGNGTGTGTETGTAFGTDTYGATISPSTPGMSKGGFEKFDSRSAFTPVSEPEPQKGRICGLRRKHFWILASITLALLIAAAVVGGLVGGLRARNKGAPVFTEAQSADVMIGSPLNVPATGKHAGTPGMAYLTRRKGSIFYVGMNGLLQEKRKIYNSTQYWEPAALNNLNIPMVGNIRLPSASDDPQNSWDSYRMAAVYSTNFTSGAGARLFYHKQQSNESGVVQSVVQELVWTWDNDTWTEGATIEGVWPNSHLAATIDESLGILRLFYSSGNKSLQESWISLSDTDGVHLPRLLDHNSADIAAVSGNGTTYLYHYASANETANVDIHELTISVVPHSPNNQESFNLSQIVSATNLTASSNAALYQPLAASKTVVSGIQDQLLVFWAENPTGDPSTNTTGYGKLSQTSRTVASSTWPNITQLQIPLGSDNSHPS
ncbi:MAG: hypothetical protein Q9217_003287 [Psora testacea]